MSEKRKLTAAEIKMLKDSGEFTEEQLGKLETMTIPTENGELTDDVLNDISGGGGFMDQIKKVKALFMGDD
ncbi:MAG: hypothetical protein E7508_03840 [Ruminococcus sp.]|nr:hypothetical protein [Ruminococcus sp.]